MKGIAGIDRPLYDIIAATPLDKTHAAINRDVDNFGQCRIYWKSKKPPFTEKPIHRDSYKHIKPIFSQVTCEQFRVQFMSGHWTRREVAQLFGKSRETVRGWLGISDPDHVLPLSFDELLKLARR
jgi:hypothetical protein